MGNETMAGLPEPDQETRIRRWISATIQDAVGVFLLGGDFDAPDHLDPHAFSPDDVAGVVRRTLREVSNNRRRELGTPKPVTDIRASLYLFGKDFHPSSSLTVEFGIGRTKWTQEWRYNEDGESRWRFLGCHVAEEDPGSEITGAPMEIVE